MKTALSSVVYSVWSKVLIFLALIVCLLSRVAIYSLFPWLNSYCYHYYHHTFLSSIHSYFEMFFVFLSFQSHLLTSNTFPLSFFSLSNLFSFYLLYHSFLFLLSSQYPSLPSLFSSLILSCHLRPKILFLSSYPLPILLQSSFLSSL